MRQNQRALHETETIQTKSLLDDEAFYQKMFADVRDVDGTFNDADSIEERLGTVKLFGDPDDPDKIDTFNALTPTQLKYFLRKQKLIIKTMRENQFGPNVN